MNILIKGMKMPKNCGDCPFGRDEDAQYYACDLSEWSCVNPDGRELRDDCPLVELPPHGRLIDADALPRIKFHDLPYPHITPSDVDAESYERGWNDVIDAIVGDAPTIIEAEGETE